MVLFNLFLLDIKVKKEEFDVSSVGNYIVASVFLIFLCSCIFLKQSVTLFSRYV